METQILSTEDPEQRRTAVQAAVDLLTQGGVVALPTETVYGLAADATNAEAVAKIFSAKERPTFDPLIVHLPHKDRLAEVAAVPQEFSQTVRQLVETFWPGPLTLILPKTAAIPDIVTSGQPTVAVRMSDHPIFKRVVTSLARPLAAPSANRFGRISPTSAKAVQQELEGRIPLILDAGACLHGLESTIVKIEPGEKKPIFRVLRAGPITKEELQPFGKVIFASHIKPKGTGEGQKPARDENQALEAPGQMESHYAPLTPLRLVMDPKTWSPEPEKRYALLSYRGEPKDGYLELADWQEVMMLSPNAGKHTEAAVRLFYCLRYLDALGVDEIIAEPVSEVGLGVAIMERLRRAAHKS
jgi:L-threonylcarbamoyladenylate synthase